jgi:predicted dehydrogenase
MNQVNIGIIGCGRIADLHYPGYRNNREARIYAVCDANEETALRRKKEWKAVKHYTDHLALLADPSIDAVEILTPHALHEPMMVDAAGAKKHIALQKPMTVDLASADRMIGAAARAGIIFRVTDNYAFYPPILLARAMIENGDIGEPETLSIMMASGSGGWAVPPSAWEWRLRENRDRGGMRGLQTFDHGHHLWTATYTLLGPVERVTAWIDSLDGVIDSPAVMMWKHAGKKVYGRCTFNHANELKIPSKYYANDEWIEVHGTRGIIFIRRCTGLVHGGPPLSLFTSKGWKHFNNVKCDWSEGFTGATRNFIAALHGKEEARLSGAHAREILRFALSMQKSSQERTEVFPEELDARFPKLYHRRRLARERREAAPRTGILERLGISGGTAQYAAQGKTLTLDLASRFNSEGVKDWSCDFGIELLAEGGTPGTLFAMSVSAGRLAISEGALPGSPVFTLKAPAGAWAAILLGRKRIETAFIQGKLKIEGKSEEALKLRGAFGI